MTHWTIFTNYLCKSRTHILVVNVYKAKVFCFYFSLNSKKIILLIHKALGGCHKKFLSPLAKLQNTNKKHWIFSTKDLLHSFPTLYNSIIPSQLGSTADMCWSAILLTPLYPVFSFYEIHFHISITKPL